MKSQGPEGNRSDDPLRIFRRSTSRWSALVAWATGLWASKRAALPAEARPGAPASPGGDESSIGPDPEEAAGATLSAPGGRTEADGPRSVEATTRGRGADNARREPSLLSAERSVLSAEPSLLSAETRRASPAAPRVHTASAERTLAKDCGASASGIAATRDGEVASEHPSASPTVARGSAWSWGHGVTPGEQFGEYLILRPLGRGGQGAVYEVEDAMGLRWALKLSHELQLDAPDVMERFKREARWVSERLQALPRDVGILVGEHYGIIEQRFYVKMRLLTGENLGQKLRREGRLSIQTALGLAAKIARALGTAHEAHAVHRDLKPENVFVESSGAVQVLDWGCLQVLEAGHQDTTLSCGPICTPGYAALEQYCLPRSPIEPAADIYALGVMLYEMLAGYHPFLGWGRGRPVEPEARPSPASAARALGTASTAQAAEQDLRSGSWRAELGAGPDDDGEDAPYPSVAISVTVLTQALSERSTESRLFAEDDAAPVFETATQLDAAAVFETATQLDAAAVVEPATQLDADTVVETATPHSTTRENSPRSGTLESAVAGSGAHSAGPLSAGPLSAVPSSAVPSSAVPSSAVPSSAVPSSSLPPSRPGTLRLSESFGGEALTRTLPPEAPGELLSAGGAVWKGASSVASSPFTSNPFTSSPAEGGPEALHAGAARPAASAQGARPAAGQPKPSGAAPQQGVIGKLPVKPRHFSVGQIVELQQRVKPVRIDHLPDNVWRLLAGMLEKKPEDRPRGALAIAAVLEKELERLGATPRFATGRQAANLALLERSLARGVRRRKVLDWSASVVGVAAAVALALGAYDRFRTGQAAEQAVESGSSALAGRPPQAAGSEQAAALKPAMGSPALVNPTQADLPQGAATAAVVPGAAALEAAAAGPETGATQSGATPGAQSQGAQSQGAQSQGAQSQGSSARVSKPASKSAQRKLTKSAKPKAAPPQAAPKGTRAAPAAPATASGASAALPTPAKSGSGQPLPTRGISAGLPSVSDDERRDAKQPTQRRKPWLDARPKLWKPAP